MIRAINSALKQENCSIVRTGDVTVVIKNIQPPSSIDFGDYSMHDGDYENEVNVGLHKRNRSLFEAEHDVVQILSRMVMKKFGSEVIRVYTCGEITRLHDGSFEAGIGIYFPPNEYINRTYFTKGRRNARHQVELSAIFEVLCIVKNTQPLAIISTSKYSVSGIIGTHNVRGNVDLFENIQKMLISRQAMTTFEVCQEIENPARNLLVNSRIE